jgi:hypothetical protein
MAIIAGGHQGRLDGGADLLGERATGVKPAAGGRIDRVRRIAGNRSRLGAAVGIERRHRGKQRTRIWVAGVCPEDLRRRLLDDLAEVAEVHDHDAIAHEAHHIEVVRDEHVGQAEIVLEVEKKIENLRLDRLVQCRDCFVE